jgi:magnesium transporter
MVKIYNTDMKTEKLEEVKEIKKGVWINLTNPSEAEIKKVCSQINIEEDFIKYPLDIEEQARIDIEDNQTLFIIDVPIIEDIKDDKTYTTMPLGVLIVGDDYVVTVSLRRNKVIDAFEKNKIKSFYTYKKTRFLLQILYLNSACYLENLKKINKEQEATVALLQESMENKDLMQLLNLQNSLIYITTSLRSNELVMEKTLRGKILKMYEEDEDILEDAIIENRQAIEMSKTYSDILTSTMDAYSSIISNNLNGVMKVLTSLTILISVPTLIASIWGMNVELPFEANSYGFVILLGVSVMIAIATFIWLRRKDMI